MGAYWSDEARPYADFSNEVLRSRIPKYMTREQKQEFDLRHHDHNSGRSIPPPAVVEREGEILREYMRRYVPSTLYPAMAPHAPPVWGAWTTSDLHHLTSILDLYVLGRLGRPTAENGYDISPAVPVDLQTFCGRQRMLPILTLLSTPHATALKTTCPHLDMLRNAWTQVPVLPPVEPL